jgi:RNA polymerase sigma-70 factor, ECF subfamily
MHEGRVVKDAALLEAWCRGDRAAGDELFERHYPSVARFFHNKVSEPAQEDLIHETFLACLTGVARFRGQARFRTYLFAIAHNVLADYLRRLNRRMARLGSETDVDDMPAEAFGPSPIATVVQHQEHRVLLEALRRIPLIHQIALELHYWEELTAAEIGEVLGIPLGTVKTRLRDGRTYLEEQLDELSRSRDALRSTTDDLDRWSRRIRAQSAPKPHAVEAPDLDGT